MIRSSHLLKAAVTAAFLFPALSHAQLVGTENFLQGDFVEVGIATNGSFGTDGDAPAGYHARGGASVPNKLGFIADVGKDGWTVGTPNYVGDYFLPGTPQEGWDIQVGTVWAKGWRGGGGTTFTGGLTGSCVRNETIGTSRIATWEGKVGDLAIRQVTTLKKDKLYFITKVTIKNTGTAPVSRIYYDRTVDPDNEVAISNPEDGGGYTTVNKLEYRLPNKERRTLVSGTGQKYNSYLGLGTKDCRAKPYIVNSGLTPTDSLSTMYEANGRTSPNATYYFVDPDTANIADQGIGVVFNVGTLNPGDSTNLSYAYVLSVADLDSAFADISPVWEYDGKRYEDGDTVKVCRPKGAPDERKNLDIVGGSGFTWSWTPRTGLENLTGTDNSIILNNETVTYIARPSEAFGCIENMKLTIQPFTDPDPPAVTSPVTYCRYGSAKPLAASGVPGARFLFYMTPTGGTGAPVLIPNTNLPGTYTFYASQVNGVCESGRTPITVVVNPLPTIDIVKGFDPTYCGGKDGYITFKTEPGKTYKVFYDKDLTEQPTLTLTADAGGLIKIPGLGRGKYTGFFVENEFGCRSITVYDIIELKGPVGVQPVISNNGPLCVGQEVQLTSNHKDSTTYIWTGPGGFSSSEENPSFTATEASAGTYSLVTDKKGCITDPELTILVINPLPKNPNVPDQALCEGNDLQVTPAATDPLTMYSWEGPGGYTSPDENIRRNAIQRSQAGMYVLSMVTDAGCTGKDTIMVAVDEQVTLSFGGDTTICDGDSATLFAITNMSQVIWSPVATLNDGAALMPKAGPKQKTTYTVTAKSDHNTCPDKSGQVTVDVLTAPTVSGYDTLIRMNIPYTIMPSYGQDAVKWRWVPADSLSCSDCPNPVFNSRTDKTYTVYVSNALGCTASDTVIVRVFCDGASVTMPNAFTPNGDGKNDLYYVRGKGFEVKRFIIYNRLGQEVFHKENFLPNDVNFGWDGTFSGAQITEAAGFVYLLEVQCYGSGYATTVMKGTVLLIR